MELEMKHINQVLFLGLSLCLITISYAENLTFNPADLQKFNTTNSCVECDLSNASLSGNHSQANLTDTNLSSSIGDFINLSEAVLIGTNLTNSRFIKANFSQADFSNAALYQADFSNANLYKAKMTTEQISQLKSVCNATLPNGSMGPC